MRLLHLRDEAEAARRENKRLVEEFQAAQERLAASDRRVDATAERFAAAIDKLGGQIVDLSSSPPKLYTTHRAFNNQPFPPGYQVYPVALIGRPEPEPESDPDDPISIGPVS